MSKAYEAFRAATDALQAEWDATTEGREHSLLFRLIGDRVDRYRAERRQWLAANSAAMQADIDGMYTRMRALRQYPSHRAHNERWRDVCAKYEADKKAEREGGA